MDFARLRFGDWIMGVGGLAVLIVMFFDWYKPTLGDAVVTFGTEDLQPNAWEAFAVTDLILALAALMGIVAFVLTVSQPTAAVPLALASLTTIVALIALLLVVLRVVWPPDVVSNDEFDTGRMTGAWLGLVATSVLAAGCLASIRDERQPKPEHQVEPRLIEP